MNQKNWGYFSSLAKRCILAGLVGTISSGCMSIDTDRNRLSSEAKNSTNIDTSSKDVRVDNSQNIDIKGNDVSVSSKTSTTMTDRNEEQAESIDKNTKVTQKNSASPKITSGRYWIGGTDQGLEVVGNRYRYYTEGGEQPWQNISNLKYIKNGVVFDGKTYWCLSTLRSNLITGCGADGWIR